MIKKLSPYITFKLNQIAITGQFLKKSSEGIIILDNMS